MSRKSCLNHVEEEWLAIMEEDAEKNPASSEGLVSGLDENFRNSTFRFHIAESCVGTKHSFFLFWHKYQGAVCKFQYLHN